MKQTLIIWAVIFVERHARAYYRAFLTIVFYEWIWGNRYGYNSLGDLIRMGTKDNKPFFKGVVIKRFFLSIIGLPHPSKYK